MVKTSLLPSSPDDLLQHLDRRLPSTWIPTDHHTESGTSRRERSFSV